MFLLDLYKYRKDTKRLEHWIILDDKKRLHKKMVKKQYDGINIIIGTFGCSIFILLLLFFRLATIIPPIIGIFLLIILIIIGCIGYKNIICMFPFIRLLAIPIFSLGIVLFLHDSKIIENFVTLEVLFIIISSIFFGFACLRIPPYIIRSLHNKQFFINSAPNIFLIIMILSMNNIKKPDLDFTKDPNFSKFPNEVQNILSNQEFVNTIRDIIYQTQMTVVTSDITTYILIISVMIFIFSALLNIKMTYDNKKAAKLLFGVRRKSIEDQKFSYRDFQKISYYGGQYYEEQLFSIPGVYKFIYDIELNK